jgi:hypothetical protein
MERTCCMDGWHGMEWEYAAKLTAPVDRCRGGVVKKQLVRPPDREHRPDPVGQEALFEVPCLDGAEERRPLGVGELHQRASHLGEVECRGGMGSRRI